MINNTAREILLQSKRGKTAFMIDALLFLGWPAGTVFSFQEAFDALSAFGTSDKLIRAGLNDPLFNRQGRRSATYTLPSPEQVMHALELQESPFKDELSAAAFKSMATYRQELYQLFLARAPGEYHRVLLAKRVGVTRVTTINYDNRINAAGQYRVYIEPRFSYSRITMKNIGALPLQKSAAGRFWLEAHTAPNVIPQKAPCIMVKALEWIKQGKEVYLTKQLPNYYQLLPAAGY